MALWSPCCEPYDRVNIATRDFVMAQMVGNESWICHMFDIIVRYKQFAVHSHRHVGVLAKVEST
jgi:hypothetical protein